MGTEILYENLPYIVLSYLLAIGVSSLLVSHDFISKRWRTIKATRNWGRTHLIGSLSAIAILLFYIIVQGRGDESGSDYKEMSTAIIACGFALLHACRTFFGLWQIYCFKNWVLTSLKSINSFYDTGNSHSGTFVDKIRVNDSIVENKLFDGEAKIYISWIDKESKNPFSIGRDVVRSILNFIPLVFIVFFDIHKYKKFVSPKDLPFIELKRPKDLWIRWATVFIANFPGNRGDLIHGEKNRNSFRETCSLIEDAKRKILLYCCLLTNGDNGYHNCLQYKNFDDHESFDGLQNGQFDVDEFIKRAKLSGSGLPFGQAHTSKDNYDYRTKLERFKQEISVDVISNVSDLDIEDLEWLLVYLSMENWKETTDPNPLKKYDASESFVVEPKVQNFMDQLNMKGDFNELLPNNFFPKLFKNISLPFLFNGNENVLQLSYHLDNWISLTSGLRTLEFFESHEENSTPGEHRTLSEKFHFEYATNSEENKKKLLQIFKINRALEQNIKTYSLHRNDLSTIENHLTFLGCGMEELRWFFAHNENFDYDWNPPVEKLQSEKITIRPMSNDFLLCLENSTLGDPSFTLKLRLLWEIHKHLSGRLNENEKTVAAVCLCLLYFPELNISPVPFDVSTEYQESQTSINFPNGMGGYEIRPVYGPQKFFISVKISMEDNSLEVSFNSEDEKNFLFCWEAWRNAFYGRVNGIETWRRKFIMKSDNTNQSFSYHTTPLSGIGIRKVRSPLAQILGGSNDFYIKFWENWMPHRISMCRWDLTYPSRLNKEQTRNLYMECIHDCYQNFKCNAQEQSAPIPKRKQILALKERAKSFEDCKNLQSAYLIYFLCALRFSDISSIAKSIALYNIGSGINLKNIYNLLREYLEKEKDRLSRNSSECLHLIHLVEKLMASTEYNIMPTIIFCELVIILSSANRKAKRDLEKRALDSIISSLESHPHKIIATSAEENTRNYDCQLINRAIGLLQKLLQPPSSQQNEILKRTFCQEDEFLQT